jgi:MSHA biogenesis protein MshN
MSLINRMLKDLEAQPARGDAAPIYRPPSRRLPGWYWWILLLLPLSLWLWWQPLQQWLHPTKPLAATPVVVAQPKPLAPQEAVVVMPTPTTAVSSAPAAVIEQPAEKTRSAPAVPPSTAQQPRPTKDVIPAPEIPDQQAITTENNPIVPNDDTEATAEPEPLGEMYVEEQKLSAGEIAALERRKYQQAMARRDNVGAQQALLQVLANDPLDLNSRKQLAALYYGDNQLKAARDILQQGITLMPTNADLRLLNARVAQAMGDKLAALQSLQAITPSVSSNLDFYAMRAALAQQLGQTAEASYSYQALTRAQPMVGRWWLGLAISQEQRGLMADAKQAYRRALLDNQLSAASRRFAQQRIQHLEP